MDATAWFGLIAATATVFAVLGSVGFGLLRVLLNHERRLLAVEDAQDVETPLPRHVAGRVVRWLVVRR